MGSVLREFGATPQQRLESIGSQPQPSRHSVHFLVEFWLSTLRSYPKLLITFWLPSMGLRGFRCGLGGWGLDFQLPRQVNSCAGDVEASEDDIARRSPPPQRLSEVRNRIALVDLNNFSTFPTLAVGILVASLRNAGFEAQVLCPLAHDVPAAEREQREWLWNHFERRVHLSTRSAFVKARDAVRSLRRWWLNRPDQRVLREAVRVLDERPAVLLLSAYLQHYPTVWRLGQLAADRQVPVLLGGPMFNLPDTADIWRQVPGVKAIVGGEVDLVLPRIVAAVCSGTDLLQFEGVMLPDGRKSPPAAPLRNLDLVPVPDFTDFPWDRYRLRVVPLMAGRGCQWSKCVFCSDVISASGRTFRTRSVESILHEMREQARRHQTANFLFLDLKLNSDPATWRGIIAGVQAHVPGAQWLGTVHVDQRKDNGLARADLRAAVSAGMRRISFGLETGSQRLLDAMHKGSSVARNSEFIRYAHEAGLSLRCTMFKGFPGETAEDLCATAGFLESHAQYLDRIRFNEFSVLTGTPLDETLRRQPDTYPELQVTRWDARNARVDYRNESSAGREYRRAKARVLRAVYRINSRPVRRSAEAFDGLM